MAAIALASVFRDTPQPIHPNSPASPFRRSRFHHARLRIRAFESCVDSHLVLSCGKARILAGPIARAGLLLLHMARLQPHSDRATAGDNRQTITSGRRDPISSLRLVGLG
jgi:hypothetical protein